MPYRSNALQDPDTQAADFMADPDDELCLYEDLTEYFKCYARERPKTVALICLGIGFVLGWKLKPW